MGKRRTILEQRADEALAMIRDVESVDAAVLVILHNRVECMVRSLHHEAIVKAALMEAVQDYLPTDDDDAEPDDADAEDEAEADD